MDKMLPLQQDRSGRAEHTLVASLRYHCAARHAVLAYCGVKESYARDVGLIAQIVQRYVMTCLCILVMVMPDDQSCDQLQQYELNNRLLLQNSRLFLCRSTHVVGFR